MSDDIFEWAAEFLPNTDASFLRGLAESDPWRVFGRVVDAMRARGFSCKLLRHAEEDMTVWFWTPPNPVGGRFTGPSPAIAALKAAREALA